MTPRDDLRRATVLEHSPRRLRTSTPAWSPSRSPRARRRRLARACYPPSLNRTVNRLVMFAYRDRVAGGATTTALISDRATCR